MRTITKRRALPGNAERRTEQIKGAFEEGYTSETVEEVCEVIKGSLNLDCVVLWDYYDMFGFGGNSEMFVRVPTPDSENDGAFDYQLHHLPEGLWEYLMEPDSAVDFDKIERNPGTHHGPCPSNSDSKSHNVAYKYAPTRQIG